MPSQFNFWGRTELTELAEEGQDIDKEKTMLEADPGLVDLRNPYQPTPFLAALSSGKASIKFLEILIQYKTDVSATSYGGRNALHCSANASNFKHLKYLLGLPGCPQISSKMENGNTALHAACMEGNEDATSESRIKAIDLLISHGADPHEKNNDGLTPADMATIQGLEDVANHLCNKYQCRITVSPPLPGSNTPLDFWDRYQLAALSINGKNIDAAKNIIDANIHSVDQAGPYQPTPLLLSVSCGIAKLAFLQLLVTNGAQLNLSYYGGKNVLHCAANAANLELFRYVMSLPNIPSINSRTDDGCTPLHAVCMYGTTSATDETRKAVARELIEKGANREAKNNQGLTPAQLAMQQGLPKLADFINCYVPTLAPKFTPDKLKCESSNKAALNNNSEGFVHPGVKTRLGAN